MIGLGLRDGWTHVAMPGVRAALLLAWRLGLRHRVATGLGVMSCKMDLLDCVTSARQLLKRLGTVVWILSCKSEAG